MPATIPGEELRVVTRARSMLWSFRNFFKKTQRTKWTYGPNFRCVEMPNNVSVYLATLFAGADDGQMFQVHQILDKVEKMEALRELVHENLKLSLDQFLLPDCRCRLGWHWRCKVHKNWKH